MVLGREQGQLSAPSLQGAARTYGTAAAPEAHSAGTDEGTTDEITFVTKVASPSAELALLFALQYRGAVSQQLRKLARVDLRGSGRGGNRRSGISADRGPDVASDRGAGPAAVQTMDQ